MLIDFTWWALTSLRNCEYVRFTWDALCIVGSARYSNTTAMSATGSNQCRHAGGGGGAGDVGRSPGGGGVACLVNPLPPPRSLVQPYANDRITSPVRGFGRNDVDLRSTRSPAAATASTSATGSGLHRIAVPAGPAASIAAFASRWIMRTAVASSPICQHTRMSNSCRTDVSSPRHRSL